MLGRGEAVIAIASFFFSLFPESVFFSILPTMQTKYSHAVLENGLRVLIGHNPTSPVVTIQLSILAGSSFESEQEAGFAHILEHMLLKGTPTRPTSYDIGLVLDSIGAYSNANTSSESTNFVMQGALENAETLCEVLSDNIQNALLDAGVLGTEKNIIIEEIKKRNNNLPSRTVLAAHAAYTQGHPLLRDTVGTEESVANATRDAIVAYKNKFYLPNNALLIVTGGLESERVLDLARKYFDAWKRSEFVLPELPALQFHAGEGHQIFKTDTAYIAVCIGTDKAPSLSEAIALDLIANRLNFGYSSILKDELRTKRGLVYGVSVFARLFRSAMIFEITTSSQKPEEVGEVIRSTIADLPNTFTDAIITQLQAQASGILKRNLTSPFFENNSLRTQAMLYNQFATPEEYLTTLNALSVHDVRAACKKFLDPARLFVFTLGKE